MNFLVSQTAVRGCVLGRGSWRVYTVVLGDPACRSQCGQFRQGFRLWHLWESYSQSLMGTDSRAVLPAAVLGDQFPVFWDSRAQWTTHGSTRLWVRGEPPIRKAS